MKKSTILLSALIYSGFVHGQKLDTIAQKQAQYVVIENAKYTDSSSRQLNLKFIKQNTPDGLEIILKRDSTNNWVYTNQGKDLVQQYLGTSVILDSSIIADANQIANYVNKKPFQVLYINDTVTPTKEAGQQNWLWIALGSLGGIGIGFLLNKWLQNMANKKEAKYGAVDFKKDIQALYSNDHQDKKKLDFTDILAYVQSLRSKNSSTSEQLTMQTDDLNKAILKSENYLGDIKVLNQEKKEIESSLQAEQQYHSAMLTQYIDAFNARFSGALVQHPIPQDDKAFFTKTIYAIALHYISYAKGINKRSDANDQKNIDAILKGIQQQPADALTLDSDNDITKYSGLLIFIAQELQRNGVQHLDNVNFRGFGFGKK